MFWLLNPDFRNPMRSGYVLESLCLGLDGKSKARMAWEDW